MPNMTTHFSKRTKSEKAYTTTLSFRRSTVDVTHKKIMGLKKAKI